MADTVLKNMQREFTKMHGTLSKALAKHLKVIKKKPKPAKKPKKGTAPK